jgi:hypothetical protein
MTDRDPGFAGEFPSYVRVVPLDTARALLARRTADLARVLLMDNPERTPWAKVLGYVGAVTHVAESHFGMPIEPNDDGTYRDPSKAPAE